MPATSLLISHREMQAAITAGRTRPLCGCIPDFRKYHGNWWVISSDGWLRVTDSHLTHRLDKIRPRLDAAEEDYACYRAMGGEPAAQTNGEA
jgi:hypothetical protein